ncbi:MAG: thiamine-phosphate kinase [Alphaproteobacteria bacterium]|nr:thiamine-phosphate kinase [Alphaproteobacteria bacterium]
MAAPDEFRLIAELFAPLAAAEPGAFGLTDDAAVIACGAGGDLAITKDAMVAGVHFLPHDPPDLVARKLVRVNVSDLAAMGATPWAVLLAAAFPRGSDESWLRLFAAGLAADLREFGMALLGGDTVVTPGPFTLSLTAIGRLGPAGPLRRAGAKPGDGVWVSGSLGDAALGLCVLRDGLALADPAHAAFLADRYHLPRPRVALGRRLGGLASAGMDISDGLVADLGHICSVSGVGAEIEAARVPLSEAARAGIALHARGIALALAGGDDYELLFTVPAGAEPALSGLSAELGLALTRIGRIVDGAGVRVLKAGGGEMTLPDGGWNHFGTVV